MNRDEQDQFIAWVCNILQHQVSYIQGNICPSAIVPIDGDAGTRRYFRIQVEPSLIAVYSPPATEKNDAFKSIAEFLRGQGLHVPKIVAEHDKGYFVVEDLGEDLYLSQLTSDSADLLYGEALMSLLRLQLCPQDRSVFPDYDRETLRRESTLFEQWFVQDLLGHTLSGKEKSILANFYTAIEDLALAQPKVIVHRDFHSRNLLVTGDGSAGIIDFQDAVIGPVTYDLVSLLRDCYISWPQEQVARWALAYAQIAIDAGVMPMVDQQTFLRWFDWMGLQRHAKVLGLFARLSLRDGKHVYLDDLPLVLAYFRAVLGQYEDFAEIKELFEGSIMPLVVEQAWMRDIRLP